MELLKFHNNIRIKIPQEENGVKNHLNESLPIAVEN